MSECASARGKRQYAQRYDRRASCQDAQHTAESGSESTRGIHFVFLPYGLMTPMSVRIQMITKIVTMMAINQAGQSVGPRLPTLAILLVEPRL